MQEFSDKQLLYRMIICTCLCVYLLLTLKMAIIMQITFGKCPCSSKHPPPNFHHIYCCTGVWALTQSNMVYVSLNNLKLGLDQNWVGGKIIQNKSNNQKFYFHFKIGKFRCSGSVNLKNKKRWHYPFFPWPQLLQFQPTVVA